MEDMPFFEAPSGSLKRATSTRRKKLRKQESLKNMTEFQLTFEVAEVKLLFFFLISLKRTYFFPVVFVNSCLQKYWFPISWWNYSVEFFSKSQLCFCILVITEMLWFIHFISQLILSLSIFYLIITWKSHYIFVLG